jgi:hypothetical protein
MVNITVLDNAKIYHSCIKKVYYDDGSSWKNPLYNKWARKYNNNY